MKKKVESTVYYILYSCMKNVLLQLVCLLLIACANTGGRRSNSIAYVDGETISLESVDRVIEKEIYDYLKSIYELRKSILDAHVDFIILDKEARRVGMSIPEMVDSIANHNGAQSMSSDMLKIYKDHIVDSLRQLHSIKILLKEPLPPTVDMDSAYHIDLLESKSPVTVTLIADASCTSCHELYPTLKTILKNYKDKINCRYVNFTYEPTLCAKALMLANEVGKASELLDTIMCHSTAPDSTRLMSILSSYSIDTSIFENREMVEYMESVINWSNMNVSRSGIDQTPTVLINNRPISNPFDSKRMREMIDRAISDMSNR